MQGWQEDTSPKGQLRTSRSNAAKRPGKILGCKGQQEWQVWWWSHLLQSTCIISPSARDCKLKLKIQVLTSLPLTSLNFANRLVALGHLGTDVIVYRHHKSKVGKWRHQVFGICRLIFRAPVPSALAPLGVMGLTQTPITGILH